MTLSAHRVPADVFIALAEGGGGATAVGLLTAAQHSKQVLLVRRVLDAARETGHPEAGIARRGYELLAAVQEKDPSAVEAVLRHPAVEGWARAAVDAVIRSRHGRAAATGPAADAGADELPAAAAGARRADLGPAVTAGAEGGSPGPVAEAGAEGASPGSAAAQAGAEGMDRGAAGPARLAALAAAAAVRAGHACSIDVPVDDGAVVLPSLGRAALTTPVATARVTVSPEHAELTWSGGHLTVPADPHSDAPGWQGLRRLHAATEGRAHELLIDDLDPFRMPGSPNVGPRLDPAEAGHWQSAFSDAWRLVVTRHPTLADEVATAIRVLTPLTPPPGGHVSATSRETFGNIALSRPVDGCALAVAFAHETQHAKLSALLDLVPMTLPDDGSRHYAPWREDPRPLSGLLQGCYAFLGVAGFWLRQAEHDADDRVEALAEFVRWRDAVRLGLGTLRTSGRLTDAGERFVAGMDRTVRAWEDVPVPAPARELADWAAREHRERWVRRNGPIGDPA